MSISGSGNVSPATPDFDPSILMGRQAASAHAAKEASGASKATETSAAEQQALISSGTELDYVTDLQQSEGKYKKTLDKTSKSPKTKLKGNFSKVRAGTKGFLTGFGTRASRISARKAENNGEGMSMIPSQMEYVKKKGNRVSPEMQNFYLGASGLWSPTSDVSSITENCLGATALSTTPLLTTMQDPVSIEHLSSGEITALASFNPNVRTASLNEQTINAWTEARLGGEMVSTLLDPNIETSSLLRRAPTVSNEGMVDVSDMGNQTTSLSMEGLVNTVVDDPASAEEEKKTGELSLEEMAAMAKMMAALLSSGQGMAVFIASSTPSSGLTQFPEPKFSGTIPHHFSKKEDNETIWGLDSQIGSIAFDTRRENNASPLPTTSLHEEASYRFPVGEAPLDVNEIPFAIQHSTVFSKETANTEQALIQNESLGEIPVSAEVVGQDTVSSAYQFPSHLGMAVLASVPLSTEDYKTAVEHRKGPGGPPDPLIYQYRNVAVDPAIIFQSPSPFSVSSRFSVQGKPEAVAVYNDDQEEAAGGNRDSDEGKDQEQDKTRETEDAGGDS
ncbi:type III secretion system effector protein [Chlamydia trachomatis]|uniref:type III secretion system effector protein n=1 Tax=Chlamydia trachomatis TaxID=813 RepID=UPI0009FB4EC6|nr:type III secretion system effector protein [Chlamydia trachomatis]